MKKYEIVALKTTFPAGILIELTPEQAKARETVLQKKKDDIYQTLEPITFKAGEVIGLDEKNLSRMEQATLKPTEPEPPPPPIFEIKVVHIGGGKYSVINESGDRLCDLGTKEQAEAALKELSEKQDGV